MSRMAFALACLAGCYDPAALAVCATRCDGNQLCPAGQMCGADSRCHAADGLECSQLEVDGGTDAALGCLGGGAVPAFQPVCDAAAHVTTMATRLLGGTIDTGMPSQCDEMASQTAGPPVCVVLGYDITVGDLSTTGPNPLAIIAINDLTIAVGSTLQAGSHAAITGPGADGAACGAGKGADDVNGAGGGAGGSFQGVGGRSGAGDVGGTAPGGPTLITFTLPATLRGGCPGTTGGSGGTATTAGGVSGGAVYLVAGRDLAINGGVFAGGHGAPGGTPYSGGGGGGSGGMVALEGMHVRIEGSTGAAVAANGGGGSGGSGNIGASAGDDATGITTAGGGQSTSNIGNDAMGGYGGMGSGPGIVGGMGANESGGVAGQQNAGGGGGGGGAGFVVVHGLVVGMTSPPFTLR